MKHNKSHYQDLNYNGYIWVGFWDDRHNFVKGNHATGFFLISCTEEQLNNGDIEFMTLHGWSNPPKSKKLAKYN